MILFLVCVCVGLAFACAALGWQVDRTRRNAAKWIASMDKAYCQVLAELADARREAETFSDACVSHKKALEDCERKKLQAIATVANYTAIIEANDKEIAGLKQAKRNAEGELADARKQAKDNHGLACEAISKLQHIKASKCG